MAWQTDRPWVLTGSAEHSLILWDLETGQALQRLQGHDDTV
jgi:hypothetical protein